MNEITLIKNKLNNTSIYDINIGFCIKNFKHTDFMSNLDSDDILKYVNLFTTDKEILFYAIVLSNDLSSYINQYGIFIFVRHYKDTIPYKLYMLLTMFLQHYTADLSSYITDIINGLTIDHLNLINYLLNRDYFQDKYRELLFNKIVSLIFISQERDIIQQLYMSDSLTEFYHFDFKTDYDIIIYLRERVIIALFSYLKSNEINIKIFRQYFVNELVSVPYFVELCCKYDLIDKDLIDKVFYYKDSFKTLKLGCMKYKEYINSLDLLNTLEDNKT